MANVSSLWKAEVHLVGANQIRTALSKGIIGDTFPILVDEEMPGDGAFSTTRRHKHGAGSLQN